MGFLLERSYEVAAEKCSVAWAQALLCTSRSRCFFISKGLQAQQVKSGDAEALSFGLRLSKWQSGFKRALNTRPVPFPFLQSQP